MKNDELLHKWINKTISDVELETFKKRPEYDSLISLYQSTEDLQGPSVDMESMLENILQSPKTTIDNTKINTQPSRTFSFPSWVKYGIAASVLLVVGYFGLMPNNSTTSLVAHNDKIEGVLPDQSTYVLSPNSTLTYNDNWSTERSVELEGEAYFSVQKGSTFSVTTTNGNVAVLGTQFSVESNQDIFKVSCTEGKVSVSSNKAEQYKEILTQGESMKLVVNKESITWKKNLTKIKNINLQGLTEELSKTYDIEFVTDNLNMSETLSCNFQHQDLDLALKTTITSLGLNYTILNKRTVQLYK